MHQSLTDSIKKHRGVTTEDLANVIKMDLVTRSPGDPDRKKVYASYKSALVRLFQDDQLGAFAEVALKIQKKLGSPAKQVTKDIEQLVNKKLNRKQQDREERRGGMVKEVLTVEVAATLLGVAPGTIYRLARAGKIPAARVGREWRFSRVNLDKWIQNGSIAESIERALKISKRR